MGDRALHPTPRPNLPPTDDGVLPSCPTGEPRKAMPLLLPQPRPFPCGCPTPNASTTAVLVKATSDPRVTASTRRGSGFTGDSLLPAGALARPPCPSLSRAPPPARPQPRSPFSVSSSPPGRVSIEQLGAGTSLRPPNSEWTPRAGDWTWKAALSLFSLVSSLATCGHFSLPPPLFAPTGL